MNLAQEKIEQLIAKAIVDLMSKALEVLTMASSLADDIPSVDNLSTMAQSAMQGASAGGDKFDNLLRQAFGASSLSIESINQLKQNLFNANAAPSTSNLQESLSNMVDSYGGISSLSQASSNNLTNSPTITSETSNSSDVATPTSVSGLMESISSIITQKELIDLISGDCDSKTLTMIHQLVSIEHSEFLPMLPNAPAISSLFKGIGNFVPLELKSALTDNINRTIPTDIGEAAQVYAQTEDRPCLSICPTPSQIDAFEDVRCALLKSIDSEITDEQCADQLGKVKDQMVSDLAALSDRGHKKYFNTGFNWLERCFKLHPQRHQWRAIY